MNTIVHKDACTKGRNLGILFTCHTVRVCSFSFLTCGPSGSRFIRLSIPCNDQGHSIRIVLVSSGGHADNHGGAGMKVKSLIFLFLVTAVISIRCPVQASAEIVAHHGANVEAKGSVKYCISCHDGATGNMIATCTSKCKTTEEHSVLKRYPPRKKPEDYAPVETVLASGLKLVKGKVVCITCHDLRKKNEYHLVIVDPGKLCKACHIRL